MRSGGGRLKFGPCSSFSVYGMSKVAWNTLCIFHLMGSSSRYVSGPNTSLIWNGPSRFGAIFLDVYPVFRFRESSHTIWPFLNGLNPFLVLVIIRCRASSWAAMASSRSF